MSEIALVGKKIGMTREFYKTGRLVPVTVINATVPLANMFGYINNLRSSTQGRAQYTMQFSHYDKVPQNVQDEVTKKTG